MNSENLKLIIATAAVALACLGGGAAVLWFGHGKLDDAKHHHSQLMGSVKDLQGKYAHATQEGPLIQATIRRFEEMRKQGVIGSENRLEWADRVRRINQRLQLQDASFTFSPQRSLGTLGPEGSYVINASSLAWHARLLHEGDLLRVLDAFRTVSSAHVAVKRCAMSDATPAHENQLESASVSERDEDNSSAESGAIPYSLVADCELDWITVSEASSARSHSELNP